MKSYLSFLEPCNRCCSGEVEENEGIVKCSNCNHSEYIEEWQLRGWRDITKNQPHFSGTILVYGVDIGRVMANWDAKNKVCDNAKATHWLRVPDPKKQINMQGGKNDY